MFFPYTPPRKCNTPFLWLSSITAFHLLPPSSSQELDGPVVRSVSCWNRLWLVSAAGTLGGADTEAVPELAGDLGQRAHAAGTGGLSALGLLGPVVCFVLNVSTYACLFCLESGGEAVALIIVDVYIFGADGSFVSRTLAGLSSGVTARSAGVLLNVERSATCMSTIVHSQPSVLNASCVSFFQLCL